MQFSPLEDRRAAYPTATTCRSCMFELRGLPGRFCPQCGTERCMDATIATRRSADFDGLPGRAQPSDTDAQWPKHPRAPARGPKRNPPVWARRFLKLPAAGFHAILLAGCGSAMLASAVPGGL